MQRQITRYGVWIYRGEHNRPVIKDIVCQSMCGKLLVKIDLIDLDDLFNVDITDIFANKTSTSFIIGSVGVMDNILVRKKLNVNVMYFGITNVTNKDVNRIMKNIKTFTDIWTLREECNPPMHVFSAVCLRYIKVQLIEYINNTYKNKWFAWTKRHANRTLLTTPLFKELFMWLACKSKSGVANMAIDWIIEAKNKRQIINYIKNIR